MKKKSKRSSKTPTKTKVCVVWCPECGTGIYSVARHDFHYCPCEALFVDGGFDYIRVGGRIDAEQSVEWVEATKQEMYDDYNTTFVDSKRKFGFIRTKESGK